MSGDIKVSNAVEICLPEVVILQEVKKGSGVEREAGSANASFSTWGIVYSVPFDLPIITGGSRGDHKTESAEDVEPAKSRVLAPLDMLQLWCLLVGDTKLLLGRDSCSLDVPHGGGSCSCSFTCVWSCQDGDGDNCARRRERTNGGEGDRLPMFCVESCRVVSVLEGASMDVLYARNVQAPSNPPNSASGRRAASQAHWADQTTGWLGK
jgi:hypothetical protein